MRLSTCAYTIFILFFCIGSLVLFLEADAVKESSQKIINNNNNNIQQPIKRSRYFDEYDSDPLPNPLTLELATSSVNSDQQKPQSEGIKSKLNSFISNTRDSIKQVVQPKRPTEELEKIPFTKPDVASQQSQKVDNISVRIQPSAGKSLVAFLFVILAIAVFTYQYTRKKDSRNAKEAPKQVGETRNKATVNNNIVIEYNDKKIKRLDSETANSNGQKKNTKRVRIEDVDHDDLTEDSEIDNNNNNNINNNNSTTEAHNNDPKEELSADLIQNNEIDSTAEDNNNSDAINRTESNSDPLNQNEAKNSSSNDSATKVRAHDQKRKDSNAQETKNSPRTSPSSSPRVTEPDECHVRFSENNNDEDPEEEDDDRNLLSTSNQIKITHPSVSVAEIDAEIELHGKTIERFELDETVHEKEIAALKLKLVELKLQRVLVEGQMTKNVISFEKLKETKRQNQFEKRIKRQEIRQSQEYRGAKTILTEQNNTIQAENLKLKEEKNAREVAELKRKAEKELEQMIWQEFTMMVKVTLFIFALLWAIQIWRMMTLNVLITLVREKFSQLIVYLLPGTSSSLSFLGKVPVLGSILAGAGSFMGILLLMLSFVAYAISFYFLGSYVANTLLVSLVVVGFGGWRHILTAAAVFGGLSSIEYCAIRLLKHRMNSPKYMMVYIPFVILAAVLGYYTASSTLTIEALQQAAASASTNPSIVNNAWKQLTSLVFKK